MSIIQELFGKSPFGPLVEHTLKVHECVEMIRPLMEAVIAEDYREISRLQNKTSRLEYEADVIKHGVREHLPRRYFLPVERVELERYLGCQDKIADKAEDFAVILTLRQTKLHPAVMDKFFEFVDQIFQVTGTLLTAAVELKNLAEVSFSGAEAQVVLDLLTGLNEEEWKADRMARSLSQDIYKLENELDPITIIFYEKMLLTLGAIANEAENAGDMLRTMIVK
jgi:predicted phosphate transport protein (TIGR00153 family)